MPVDIGRAVREGVERTTARNGLLFVGILFVVGILNGLFSTEVTREVAMAPAGRPEFAQPGGYAPSLGLSPVVAGALSVLLALVSVVVTLGMVRTFVSGETETIPTEHFSRNLLWAVLNLIVGSIVFGIAVGIGLLVLVVPGLFLLVSLFFWNVYVIVEDQNFVEGFRNSWSLTAGRRLRLFGLGVVVAVIGLAINLVFGLPGLVLPDVLGFVLAQVGSAASGVFWTATVARTYVQLREGGAEEGDVVEGETED